MRAILLLLLFLSSPVIVSKPTPDPRVKRDGNSSSTLSPPFSNSEKFSHLLSNHLNLGKVFDSLFISMRLFQKRITGDHVLAGVYGNPDIKPLQMILQFNETDFISVIKQMESGVPKIPSKVTPSDLSSIEESLSKLSVFNSTVLNLIKSASSNKTIPGLVRFPPIQLSFLMDDATGNLIKRFEAFKNASSDSSALVDDLMQFYSLTSSFIINVRQELKNQKDQKEHWNDFLRGIHFAKILHGDDLHLRAVLNATSSNELLEHLKNGFLFEQILHDGLYLQNWHRALHNHSGKHSIGASFIDQHLFQIYNILNDTWIKKMLNNGTELNYLRTALSQMRAFTKQFTSVDRSMNALMDHPNVQYKIDAMMDFVIDVKHLHWFAVNSENMRRCFVFNSTHKDISFDMILSLEIRSNFYYNTIQNISDIIKNTDLDKMEAIGKYSSEQLTSIFKNWNADNKTEFNNIEAAVIHWKPTLESLKSAASGIVSIVQNFNDAMKQRDKLEEWIQLDMDSCNQYVPMEIGNFSTYNLFPQIHNRVNNANLSTEFEKFFNKVDLLRKDLSFLNTVKVFKPQVLVENRYRQFEIHRETELNQPIDTLMHIGNIFRTFLKINEIHQKKNEVETILKSGDYAVDQLKGIQHPRHRTILEAAWRDWDTMKEDLKRIQENVGEVIRAFNITPESSLKEIGEKYLNISIFPFTKDIHHQPNFNFGEKHDSLRLLNQSDTELQKLKESLQSLSKPINLDWTWVNARFENLGLYLEDVEKAMQTFHRLEKSTKRSSKWHVWKEEKRRAQSKVKNKEWIDNVVLEKARFMAIVATCMIIQVALFIWGLGWYQRRK